MRHGAGRERERGFSALQRAEIAEMMEADMVTLLTFEFQCSSTSRNC